LASSDDKQLGLDPILVHGARAVRAGVVGEAQVRSIFESYRVKVVKDNSVYHNAGGDLWARTNQILIPQYPYRDVKFDLMYINFQRNIYLPIECKNQITARMDKKIRALAKVRGRLVFNDGAFLVRAIERLVEHGET
jgi:hypothetical protein